MSSNLWSKERLVIPAAHIRGSERGIRDRRKGNLKMVVNHYTPLSTSQKETTRGDSKPRDSLKTNQASAQPTIEQQHSEKVEDDIDDPVKFSIIVIQGILTCKELFEPFIDDLLTCGDCPIQDVWIADPVYSGESYLVNKDNLGDEVHVFDFGRDLLFMIDLLQDRFAGTYIVPIAFSYGTGTAAAISGWHPRLFAGMVMLECMPGFRAGQKTLFSGKSFPGYMFSFAKTEWKSREEAAQESIKGGWYQGYDPRVWQIFTSHEFMPVGGGVGDWGTIQPNEQAVTVTRPTWLAATHYLQAEPPLQGRHRPVQQYTPPEAREGGLELPGFVTIDHEYWYEGFPRLRAPVLYVWGDKGMMAKSGEGQVIAEATGTAYGGSGGIKAGKCQQVWIPRTGHSLPFHRPKETALAVLPWLNQLKKDLEKEKKWWKNDAAPWDDKLPKEWMQRMSKL